MAACSSLRSLFETPLPEKPTLMESLNWSQKKHNKPMEHSVTELFGELHFQEKPDSGEDKHGRNCNNPLDTIFHSAKDNNYKSNMSMDNYKSTDQKHPKPMEQPAITEIFGELHFQEKPRGERKRWRWWRRVCARRLMAESSGSVSVDVERLAFGGQEHVVQTRHGSLVVAVYGEQDKPALVTYPDVALNFVSCFQGLFFCPEAASLLLHNFCVYHISPPGHELGAASISSETPVLSVDELADQVADVLDFFGLGSVMCLGVTAGAYILTLFATKYRERVLGLILVSPLCKAPSWTEWLYNKVMSNLLYYYGMCGLIKEGLLQRYFSKEVRGGSQFSESDIVLACRRLLDERQSANVWRFLQSINQRHDLTGRLKRLKCRTLIFVGENSPFHSESLHMTSKVDRRYIVLVEVQACGSVVTEEQPHAMLMPMEYFFMGYGLYRPTQLSGSPRSPLSPSCISPELLSPESMGVKLKPIKTRISLQV